MTIKRFAALAFTLLLPLAAQAFDCLPRPWSIWPDETWRRVDTPAGSAYAWWCELPQAPGATTISWRRQIFVVLAKHRDLVKWGAASARALAASDVMAAANAELAAAQVTPPPGTLDEYEGLRLAYLACSELAKPPYPAVFNAPLPADWCDAAPVPPAVPVPNPPPPTQYVVSATQAFPLRADGTRSITPWPSAPTPGEPCDCAVQVIQFGSRFCKVPRLTTNSTTVVAGCRVK